MKCTHVNYSAMLASRMTMLF